MNTYEPIKSGKVREIYAVEDALIMVATDRISAFDHILDTPVPDKGVILTKLSKFWFDYTADIVPNHLISIDEQDMPPFFQTDGFRGRSMKCRRLQMLPLECIVRGYITGSGWASYNSYGTVCGIPLPPGLKEAQKFPEPLFTPSTKAELGEHDENVSFEEAAAVLEKTFPGHGEEYAALVQDYTIAIYKKCADYALGRGIIIADTKLEFGLDETGRIILADEALTPDSSRFWPQDGYEPGHVQPSYDKQFVRDYLKAHPEGGYSLPPEVVERTVAKYQEVYERLTGEKL